ncbi:MAG: hypothetical protein ACJ8AK_11825 [Gemmatimonadaceae bacterium]
MSIFYHRTGRIEASVLFVRRPLLGMGNDPESFVWRWIGRAWTLKEILSSAAVAGILTTAWAYFTRLPPVEIVVTGAAGFLVIFVGAVEIRRFRAVSFSPSRKVIPGSPALGTYNEQYIIDDLRRTKEENRKTQEHLEAIEAERSALQVKYDAKEQSEKQAISRWQSLNKLFDEVFAMQKQATGNYMRAYQAIVDIEAALLDKSPSRGLLDVRAAASIPETQRIADAQAVITRYRSESLGTVESNPAPRGGFLSRALGPQAPPGTAPEKGDEQN